MKIATYNVNGINGRLPVLLRWLELAEPDIVCLQELKVPQEKFPEKAIRDAGYDVIWHGQSRWNGVALLSRLGEIQETRRGLPGDPHDEQSRYIEAAVGGVLIAGFYLPNGNPWPGPKFDYKLKWMERLHAHLATLYDIEAPVVACGDYNVIPTEQDAYKPEKWKKDALFHPKRAKRIKACSARAGPTPFAIFTPMSAFTATGPIGASPSSAMPASALTIYCSTRRRRSGSSPTRAGAYRPLQS
ncbi:exodeoxyribonuclease III [Sphingopyxis sp. OAS728]|nr:exodeoxyribonuclease III [Sphingopyxis sp. OAS728]MBE1526886.1 exodeoxyribonuclease III [Sphingopyxis sp. OAS728]